MMAYKLDMSVKPVLAAVNDVFDLPYGKVKLFCKAVVCNAVQQSALKDHSVALGVPANYPVFDVAFKL